MLWKCCTQYARKLGKLSSGHRTGKGQFSFQSQRRAMPKNAQTTAHLHSSHMLAKWCSKFSKPGFNSTWTVNFQMFKLDLKRQRNQRSNCQHPLDHRKSKRIPEQHLLLLIDYAKAFDCVDHNKLQKILKLMGIPNHLTCLMRNLYTGQEATVRTRHGKQTGSKLRMECIKAAYCHPVYLTSMQSTSCEIWAGWITSWNQDGGEKYQ